MTRRLKVFCAYRGTAYHGFQRQENAITVQYLLEKAVGQVLGGKCESECVSIHGCSRTDTGVHAKKFCFHLDTNSSIPLTGFQRGVNTLLPKDISIISAHETDSSFHARFSCVGKEYLYRIHNREYHDPLAEDLSLHIRRPIDLDMLRRNAADFVGEHDFASFCASGGKVNNNTVRRIFAVKVLEDLPGEIGIYVRGNGFLYNMVRIMVGTLLYIVQGRLPDNAVPEIIMGRNRMLAGQTAPAHALYLNDVFYDDNIFDVKY